MAKTLALLAAAAVGLALAHAATRPDRFEVARSISINAPQDVVLAYIASPRAMSTWNPFEKQDPEIRRRYTGPESGPGAAIEFEGPKAGSGRVEVKAVDVPSRIAMHLSMTAPLRAENDIEFRLERAAAETRVTWTMRGRSPFYARVIQLFFDMDRMVGGRFEAGLVDLKALIEAAPKDAARPA